MSSKKQKSVPSPPRTRFSQRLQEKSYSSIYERPLDSTIQEIRLLEILLDDSDSSPVAVKIHVVSLNDDPEFTALSYVWGDPNETKDISIRGKKLPVTINLEAALKEIRRSDRHMCEGRPRSSSSVPSKNKDGSNVVLGTRIWIDALCINQLDDLEKSLQVRKMDQIYRRATQVFIWLGESDPETSKGPGQIKAIAAQAREHRINKYDYAWAAFDASEQEKVSIS